ncbi:ArsR family transcriptional regulator [Kineosporia sp. A_224]|uniref:ArsR family transcriptional regulator n=1 Tax=Kineosporia sp. A_224 TaxID=1962180 RepID=UPI000B4AC61B|nr:ArsR family transcriptional regulator [Kineosporia sp. A_224]
MRTAPPPLLPVFRSRLQGDVLALVCADPAREWTIEELADRTRQPYQTVAGEVRRLSVAALLTTRSIGRTKLVRADETNPYFEPLARLVSMSFGPQVVVAEEFADLAGVDEVVVVGSWAARYLGEPGPPPNDVDVLLVGSPDRDDAYAAASRAQDRLGRDVNVILRTADQWARADDAFTRQLRGAALLRVLPRA